MSERAGLWRGGLIALYLLSAAAVLAVLAAGADFYRTPLLERAHHDGYWQWKAGGSVGHTLGVVGSSMMVLMLLYSVRKRVGALRRLGPLGRWLDVHIFLGVFGPLLVVLHSSFKVQGLVALSFWSMVVVASSGVLGRYLYLQIPRTRAGEELALAELEAEDRELSGQLRTRFRLDEAQLAGLDALVGGPGPRRSSRRLRPARHGRPATPLGAARLRAELPVGPGAGLRASSSGWCGRRPRCTAASCSGTACTSSSTTGTCCTSRSRVVMYLFMIVHVAVALVTGYGWVGRS